MIDAAPIRLQKILATAGIAARRHAETLIREGRVRVNGNLATLGDRADPRQDRITFDDQPVKITAPSGRAYLLHKPRGRVCTRAASEGRTIFEFFPDAGPTLLTAGRLDKNSEGALLLSDVGDWINRWTHPSFDHEKVYLVSVRGPLRGETFRQLNAPMLIDGYQTRPASVRFARAGDRPGRMILEFILREGRNRQIRKMCEQAGLTVQRLVRTRIGSLTLAGLKPGQWRELTSGEIAALNHSPSSS